MTPEHMAWTNNIIELDGNGQEKICCRRVISMFLDLMVAKDYNTISDIFDEINKTNLSITVSLLFLTLARYQISSLPSVKQFFVAFEKRLVCERGEDETKKLMTVLYDALGSGN